MKILTYRPESVGLTPQALDECEKCKRVRRRLKKLPAWLLCDFHAGYVAGYPIGWNDSLAKAAE